MITREEAFNLVLQANSIMKMLITEAEKGEDITKAVYNFLKIARQADEWNLKLDDIRHRDWMEWCKTHEASGHDFNVWWNNGEPQ